MYDTNLLINVPRGRRKIGPLCPETRERAAIAVWYFQQKTLYIECFVYVGFPYARDSKLGSGLGTFDLRDGTGNYENSALGKKIDCCPAN